jgi:hypothetical protein
MIPGRGDSRDGKQPGGIVRGARGEGDTTAQTNREQGKARQVERILEEPQVPRDLEQGARRQNEIRRWSGMGWAFAWPVIYEVPITSSSPCCPG